MGSSHSKVQSSQLSAELLADAKKSDTENTNRALEAKRWERIYKERFSREFKFS